MKSTLEQQIRERWKHCGGWGSQLGRIETLVTQYCLLKRQLEPPTPRISLFLFRTDGPPSSVLGLAQSLSRHQSISLNHLTCPPLELAKDSVRRPLDAESFHRAIETGRADAHTAAQHCDFAAVGEHSCGSSLASSVITGTLLEMNAIDVTGREPGQDVERYLACLRLVDLTLGRHETRRGDGKQILRQYGGPTFARLAGFLLGAAEAKLPVMLDGFATAAVALCSIRMSPDLRNFLFFSHRSPEPGHGYLLDAMAAEPLLDLQIWREDGIGALLALGVFQSSWQIYSELGRMSANSASPLN